MEQLCFAYVYPVTLYGIKLHEFACKTDLEDVPIAQNKLFKTLF